MRDRRSDASHFGQDESPGESDVPDGRFEDHGCLARSFEVYAIAAAVHFQPTGAKGIRAHDPDDIRPIDASTIEGVVRKLSIDQLASEASTSLELIELLTEIGVLDPKPEGW